jgi:hypothetical protein
VCVSFRVYYGKKEYHNVRNFMTPKYRKVLQKIKALD